MQYTMINDMSKLRVLCSVITSEFPVKSYLPPVRDFRIARVLALLRLQVLYSC